MSGALFFVVEGQEREAPGVLVVALANAEPEENDRADDQHQTHEHLQNQDLHEEPPRLPSAVVTIAMDMSDEHGISTAQSSGVISPA